MLTSDVTSDVGGGASGGASSGASSGGGGGRRSEDDTHSMFARSTLCNNRDAVPFHRDSCRQLLPASCRLAAQVSAQSSTERASVDYGRSDCLQSERAAAAV